MIKIFGVSPQVFTQKIEPDKKKEFARFFSSLMVLIQNPARSSLILDIKAENGDNFIEYIQKNIDQSMQPNYVFFNKFAKSIFKNHLRQHPDAKCIKVLNYENEEEFARACVRLHGDVLEATIISEELKEDLSRAKSHG